MESWTSVRKKIILTGSLGLFTCKHGCQTITSHTGSLENMTQPQPMSLVGWGRCCRRMLKGIKWVCERRWKHKRVEGGLGTRGFVWLSKPKRQIWRCLKPQETHTSFSSSLSPSLVHSINVLGITLNFYHVDHQKVRTPFIISSPVGDVSVQS